MVQLPQLQIYKNMKSANKKGLTILETIVAIGITSVVIGAAVTLIINVSNYGSSAEARSVAVNYGQEAVDVVKNVRDNNYCNFFSASYPNNRYYTVNCSLGICSISSPSVSQTWQSKYPSGSTESNATSGSSTPGGLSRSLRIESAPGSGSFDGRRITVEVRWETKGTPGVNTYKIVTDLYKWKY